MTLLKDFRNWANLVVLFSPSAKNHCFGLLKKCSKGRIAYIPDLLCRLRKVRAEDISKKQTKTPRSSHTASDR